MGKTTTSNLRSHSVFALVGLFCTACGGGGGGGSDINSSELLSNGDQSIGTAQFSIDGQIQKGPFIFGTEVLISELDESLLPTGYVYLTQTTDDLGKFSGPATITSKYVEMRGDGYYMDELTGRLSTSRVMLRAIADLSVDNTPTINVLTTLQTPRLKTLLRSGVPYQYAYTQSQQEVLNAFGISADTVNRMNTLFSMSIDGAEDQDAVLLATSSILSKMAALAAHQNGSAAPAELSYYLSVVSADLDSDGILSSPTIISERNTATTQLDLPVVRSNVETYYSNKGVTLVAPRFEEWIDKDLSGVLPRRITSSPTGLSFLEKLDGEHSTVYNSNVVTVGGLPVDEPAFVTGPTDATLLKNGAPSSTNYSTAVNGDTFAIRATSGTFGESQTHSLTVGAMTADWVLATRTPTLFYTKDSDGSHGGESTFGRYYAHPFQTGTGFIAKYLAIGMWPDVLPVALSIYSNDPVADLPGTVIASTNTMKARYGDGTVVPGDSFFGFADPFYSDELGGVHQVNAPLQAFLGSSGVALEANTKYWVVLSFQGQANHIWSNYRSNEFVDFSEKKVSTDLVNWSNWGSGGFPLPGARSMALFISD